MMLLDSPESVIVAAGDDWQSLCQGFVLKDKATFSSTLAELYKDVPGI